MQVLPTWLLVFLQFGITWTIILFGYIFYKIFKEDKIRLPSDYYRKKEVENPRIYNLLGVPRFRYLLTHTFFKYANQRIYMKGRGRAYLKEIWDETRQSETSHIFTGFLTFLLIFIYLIQSSWVNAFILLIFNFIFNIYPVLLQRHTRIFILEARWKNLFV